MIPVGLIVGLGLRALMASSNGSRPGSSVPRKPPPTSRGSGFMNDPGSGLTVVLMLIAFPTFVGATMAGVQLKSWFVLCIGLSAGLVLFPWWVTRKVLVPLGLHRLAFAVAGLSRVTWRRDKPGGPALAAAWALAQSDKPSEKALAWVEQRLDSKAALQASSAAAMGLLAAMRGQRAEARRLMESVFLFDERIAVRPVRVIAAEWLATDAAAEGDWAKVKATTTSRRSPTTRTLLLLDTVARRQLGEPVSALGLWFFWLLAPRRLWTFGFVRRTVNRPLGARAPSGVPRAPPEWALDGVGQALHSHHALSTGTPTGQAVATVALAWERALGDPALRTRLFQRAMVLGGGDPDEALTTVRDWVEQELSAHADTPLDGPAPAMLRQALAARRDTLHRELDEHISRMDARKLSDRRLPTPEEWREVVKLKDTYAQLCTLGDPSERGLAHSVIRDRLVNFGVWLFNLRDEKPVANAIFRFLQAEAFSLGDADAAALNEKNANCGL